MEGDEIGIRDLLAAVEKRIAELRSADQEATRLANLDLAKDIDRLEKDVLSRISELEKKVQQSLSEESYD